MTLSSTGIQRIGETFQFICEASGFLNLNAVITYYWINSQSGQVRNNSTTLSLDPVRLSHAGEYTCMVIINSTYLGNNLTPTATANLTVESKW